LLEGLLFQIHMDLRSRFRPESNLGLADNHFLFSAALGNGLGLFIGSYVIRGVLTTRVI